MVWFETWFRFNCPKCTASNWLYSGHSDDQYGPDSDAAECWSCHHKFWLDEAVSREIYDCEHYEGEEDEVEDVETFEQKLESSAQLCRENPDPKCCKKEQDGS